jgi:hypothetical protein
VSESEHFNMEAAVLPAQIEQLPDLDGYLKLASNPHWLRVHLDAVRRWQEVRSQDASRAPIGLQQTLQRVRPAEPEKPTELQKRAERSGPAHERE